MTASPALVNAAVVVTLNSRTVDDEMLVEIEATVVEIEPWKIGRFPDMERIGEANMGDE